MAVKAQVALPNVVGVYVGYPGGAAYEASLSQYVATVGAAPGYVDVFVDASQPLAQWVHGSQAEASRLSASTYGAAVVPVVSVPFISTLDNGLSKLQNFAAITSGADDSIWLGIVQAYQAQGYTTIDLRLGEEQNGNNYPWSIYTTAEAQAYIAAFDHISSLVHNVAGITVNVIWNPQTVTTSALPTTASYPGNAYVDMIGVDSYDFAYPLSLYDWSTHTFDTTLAQWEANPVNLQHYWTYPDATSSSPTGTGVGFGLADAIAFAKANGKPLAFPEVGAGGPTGPSADDGLFPQYLATTLAASGVPIAFANIWDSGTFTFSDGSKPKEAAGWAAFVKALNSKTQSKPGPSGGGGSITVGHGKSVNLTSQLLALIKPGLTGDTETITAIKSSLGGVTLGAGGVVTYKAAASGTGTLTYTVSDQRGDKANFTTAIVTDAGPKIAAGSTSVAQGATVSLGAAIAALITPGLIGDTETITAISAAKGSVTLGAKGAITYKAPTTAAATAESDTLTYTVTDQYGDTATGFYGINVAPVTISGSTFILGPSYPAYGAAQSGVTVSLINASGAVVATTLSSASGWYVFRSFSPGAYQLKFTPVAGEVLSPTGIANVTTGLTAAFTPAPGQSYTEPNVNFVKAAAITGSMLLSGAALAGATVSLLDKTGNVIASTTTSGVGIFTFGSLEAGAYQVRYTPPAHDTLAAGGPASIVTNLTAPISLTAGQTVTLAAETVTNAAGASVSGSVIYAGAGKSGVAVALQTTAGKVVATTTTNSTGIFDFTGVTPGSYQVKYTAPVGEALASGGPASTSTGLTSALTLTTGQVLSLGTETLIPAAGKVTGKIFHLGSADPIWGTAQSGVGVALVNAAGVTVATAVTAGTGYFQFSNVAAGTYHYVYTLPAGEAFQAGGSVNPSTGVSTSFVLTAGSVPFTAANVVSSSNSFALNGAGAIALRSDGNYTVTGTASGGTLKLGNGNDTVHLTGGGDTITVGAGNSTITALGANNLVTVGPGMSFITVDASGGNKFVTLAAGQGLETISGFTAKDVLGLSRTLAGRAINKDLSNLGSYVTAVTHGDNTTLLVTPNGSGAASAFAELNGVKTTVAGLISGHNISLT